MSRVGKLVKKQVVERKNKKIEILVVNHKPSYIPDNILLKPIQVGKALHPNKLEGMKYYDDTGINISIRNRSYCELTAVYWAWKNLDIDYYGLFHYRRYFSFAPDKSDNPFPGKSFRDIPSAIKEIHLNEADMRRIIEEYDVLIPRKDDTKATTGENSIYLQYANEHRIKDLDYCIKYITDNYPSIAPYLDSLHDSRAYFCNMFIMKKEVFNEYCSFIFDVLEDFEKNNDISSYNPQQYRVTGYIAERLTNVFLHYLIGQGKYKIKELQIAYFENTDPIVNISPIAKKNNIGIVLAADNYYTPYISTLLRSLVNNVKQENLYDIIILHKDITQQNQEILRDEFLDYANLSIRFYNLSSRLSDFKDLSTKWHITIETYFRLLIPEILKDYDKVVYLDGDMLIKRDIAELYFENIEGYLLAACRDVDMAGVYTSNLVPAENTLNPRMKEYIDNVLRLKNPYDYFQAGVLILNLKEIRKQFSTHDLLSLAAKRKWEYLDQDVLNYLCQGRVKFLDMKWNVLYDWEYLRIKEAISKAPIKLFEEYIQSRKNPYIIHYGGTIKPWQRADADYAIEFWKIARNSVFYELILSRMTSWSALNSASRITNDRLRLRTRVARKLRRGVDKFAPVGTQRRKPITLTSRAIKRFMN